MVSPAACVAGRLCPRPRVSPAACVAGRLCPRRRVSQAACVPGRVFPRRRVSQAACVPGRVCPRPRVSPAALDAPQVDAGVRGLWHTVSDRGESTATLPTPGLSGNWSSRLRRACDLPGLASPAPLIPHVPSPWLIRVLRLITGTGVPWINYEARINHENEPDVAAVTEAACMRAFPGGSWHTSPARRG